ncbi:MAG: discoidin domain-containing protein [Verrucomicrobia bacterium]|nr:discoidin domain-containing protein [Verrucomicrobiota bacterium]MCF7708189.1 discoidin domain-containing protein [Verrucomicrobiota bacterium]
MKNTVLALLYLIAAPLLLSSIYGAETNIDLSGKWNLRLDPEDKGEQEEYYLEQFRKSIVLPGSIQEQGFGEEITVDTDWTGSIKDKSWFTDAKYKKYRRPGNIKIPFWLQPEKHYVGAAWFQRQIEIPEAWNNKRVFLYLERPHWQTIVWIDGERIGTSDSLSTPHVYELTERACPGTHTLTVQVDNSLIVDVGINAHSVTDHTQSNWNGIVGKIRLFARPRVMISNIRIFPDVENRAARIEVELDNSLDVEKINGEFRLSATAVNSEAPFTAPTKQIKFASGKGAGTVTIDYELGEDAPLWDEFDPALIRLTVEMNAIVNGERMVDVREATFGLREFETSGTQFTINGRTTFLRGTLECCIFPLTGYPHMDVSSWKRIISTCKDFGLNHMRFHSWCPPEAAFIAADELGFYFQVECGAWTGIGDGEPIDDWIYAEGDRILREYGNHPSFVLMAYGNEPGGENQERYLSNLVRYWKEKDPRRLYTSAAGWPLIDDSDFHNTPAPRIQQWGQGLNSRINAKPPETETDYRDFVGQFDKPVISHEIGQWCVFPNFDEIPKYTGVLKPKNFEIFRDFLVQNHMGDLAREFLRASGKLQVLCYKEEIESALRTPGFGGFQLLDLHDFPGQGTALVGVLDPFWDTKGYVTADEYSRFCDSTVVLLRMPRRIYTSTNTFKGVIEVAHFGKQPLDNAIIVWSLVNSNGEVIEQGEFPESTIPIGNAHKIADIKIDLSTLETPEKYSVVAGIRGTDIENTWDIWVYPEKVDCTPPEGLVVTQDLDKQALKALNNGGKVLLLIPPESVRTPVEIGFSSIFWNTAWTGNQPPHTLGIYCDPAEPALSRFPTECHSDWQWWELISNSAAMVIDAFPPRLRPIVTPIDTWFKSRRLALIFEGRIGKGKILVCSIDLKTNPANRPGARQLLKSLIDYIDSTAFDPEVELNAKQIRDIYTPPFSGDGISRVRIKNVRADNAAPEHPASNACDGDPNSFWHTEWRPDPQPLPHSLIVDLDESRRLAGLSVLPRQDMVNGRIHAYEIYTSENDSFNEPPVCKGKFANTGKRQYVEFENPVKARFVKVKVLSEAGGNQFTSLAEIRVFQQSPSSR